MEHYTTSLENFENTMKEFETKMDEMSRTTKIMKEEQERIMFVSNWEVKQKCLEEELSFVDEWYRKNNLIILGCEEYLHESYFDMWGKE
jgi:hypothetical protein